MLKKILSSEPVPQVIKSIKYDFAIHSDDTHDEWRGIATYLTTDGMSSQEGVRLYLPKVPTQPEAFYTNLYSKEFSADPILGKLAQQLFSTADDPQSREAAKWVNWKNTCLVWQRLEYASDGEDVRNLDYHLRMIQGNEEKVRTKTYENGLTLLRVDSNTDPLIEKFVRLYIQLAKESYAPNDGEDPTKANKRLDTDITIFLNHFKTSTTLLYKDELKSFLSRQGIYLDAFPDETQRLVESFLERTEELEQLTTTFLKLPKKLSLGDTESLASFQQRMSQITSKEKELEQNRNTLLAKKDEADHADFKDPIDTIIKLSDSWRVQVQWQSPEAPIRSPRKLALSVVDPGNL